PKLYVACAISGAAQHMAGCGYSKTIVAVNRDPDAPIYQPANIRVVRDYKKVIPPFQKKCEELLQKCTSYPNFPANACVSTHDWRGSLALRSSRGYRSLECNVCVLASREKSNRMNTELPPSPARCVPSLALGTRFWWNMKLAWAAALRTRSFMPLG